MEVASSEQILVCDLQQKFQNLLQLGSDGREPGQIPLGEDSSATAWGRSPGYLYEEGAPQGEEPGGTSSIIDQDRAAQGNWDESCYGICLLRLMC